MYYANRIGVENVLDAYGYETGERKVVYDEPSELWANISASVGNDVINAFGSFTNYSHTISLVNNPLKEGALIWYGVEPTEKQTTPLRKLRNQSILVW